MYFIHYRVCSVNGIKCCFKQNFICIIVLNVQMHVHTYTGRQTHTRTHIDMLTQWLSLQLGFWFLTFLHRYHKPKKISSLKRDLDARARSEAYRYDHYDCIQEKCIQCEKLRGFVTGRGIEICTQTVQSFVDYYKI